MTRRDSPVARETAEIPPHPSAIASAFGYQPSRPFIQLSGDSLESLLDCFFFGFHASEFIISSLDYKYYFLTIPLVWSALTPSTELPQRCWPSFTSSPVSRFAWNETRICSVRDSALR